MELTYKKIEELIPYENNPRKNDNAVDAVAASIKEFGFKVPVILDADNVIVCGHTRYRAAQKIGIKEIPCIMADDLSDEQIRAFRLADNKTAELAEWDFSLLDFELENIDMDMSEFGFDDISVDEFGTDFSLPDGDKPPFKQLTFTLAAEQATQIEEILKFAKSNGIADYYDNYGNENGNGNVLFGVVKEWEKLKA